MARQVGMSHAGAVAEGVALDANAGRRWPEWIDQVEVDFRWKKRPDVLRRYLVSERL